VASLTARVYVSLLYNIHSNTKRFLSQVCGYGDSWCGDTCISNCDAKAECGKDAEDPSANCPLNVSSTTIFLQQNPPIYSTAHRSAVHPLGSAAQLRNSAARAVRETTVEISRDLPAKPTMYSRPKSDTMSLGPVEDLVMGSDPTTLPSRH
jgi:hypothetical protein